MDNVQIEISEYQIEYFDYLDQELFGAVVQAQF